VPLSPLDTYNNDAVQDIDWQSRTADKLLRYKTAIFLGYNYYRLFLAGCLALLYFFVPDQQFIGKNSPELFERTISAYLAMNLMFALLPPSWCKRMVSTNVLVFVVLSGDIIFFGAQMYSSGGVNGILGNFLIVPIAFSGVLVNPRYSVACAALGFIVSYYAEFNLYIRELQAGPDGFYEAGLLGIALFVISSLFQYLSRQLRKRHEEIETLERFHEMKQLTRRTQQQLATTHHRFKALLQSAGEGVLGLEADGSISFANRRAALILDSDATGLTGSNIMRYLVEASDAGQDQEVQQPVPRVLQLVSLFNDKQYDSSRWQTRQGKSFFVEYSCEPVDAPGGERSGAVVVFQDITKRREDEARLSHLANFDNLTDLANRAFFNHSLRREITRAERRGSQLAVMYIDMDRFKYFNDSLGHAGGDELLQSVASRLLESVREVDVVARLGGDEFAIILTDLQSAENATRVAETIQAAVAEDLVIQGKQINPSVSIGIATSGVDGKTVDSLLQAADTALYAAKNQGGGAFRCFQKNMQKGAEESRRIQALLGSAVQNREFQMFYQPIYAVREGTIRCMEALIRWTPTGGAPIGPNVFIPVAEDSGQIASIGTWIVGEVCRQLMEWREEFDKLPSIAINVSARQLATDEFRIQFQQQLKAFHIPPDMIELELTETAVMHDPEFVLSELTHLRDLGVKISMDDFGTGYSSLDYLRQLPLDAVKIDRSFTQGIGESRNDEELIRLMITVAHTLDLEVIAEGVETQEQLSFLEGLNCDMVQGYLKCPPGPPDGLVRELIAGN
jgi:diguanylate cyclase (GGDEF)-like protein/PAS domain S-box-containing protein